ncbi:DUF317 domain-containing protein [Streptomyces sp. SID3343]|uniref:DUF317 domain-containing protein n=1 Tax=Streptomyces sp. SID3343 TaxID=2690260 RepID=UPI0031F9C8F8
MHLTLLPAPTRHVPTTAPHPDLVHMEGDRWIKGAGTPYPVLDLLVADGWSIVLDHRADVHAGSPDGRAYVGYLPESPHTRLGDLWHITVEGTADRPGWEQVFGAAVPAEVVAGFVAALLTARDRPDEF